LCASCTAQRGAARSARADAQRAPQGKTKQLPRKTDANTGGYIISYNETLDLCVPTRFTPSAALLLRTRWRACTPPLWRRAASTPRRPRACRARPPAAPPPAALC
jgi:hypothetical protein